MKEQVKYRAALLVLVVLAFMFYAALNGAGLSPEGVNRNVPTPAPASAPAQPGR